LSRIMDTIQCLNFRDIGEALDTLGQKDRCRVRFPTGRVFRGGSIDFCNPSVLRNPKTVINLTMGPDNLNTELFTKHKAKYIQHALPNNIDKYHTHLREVRGWLNDVFVTLSTLTENDLPILFHCRAGKDRTGIVVAALLIVLGFPTDIVYEEFLLSPGATRADIEAAMAPIVKDPKRFYRKVNIDKLRNFLTTTPDIVVPVSE